MILLLSLLDQGKYWKLFRTLIHNELGVKCYYRVSFHCISLLFWSSLKRDRWLHENEDSFYFLCFLLLLKLTDNSPRKEEKNRQLNFLDLNVSCSEWFLFWQVWTLGHLRFVNLDYWIIKPRMFSTPMKEISLDADMITTGRQCSRL